MRTTIELDDTLMSKAMNIINTTSEEIAITIALEGLVKSAVRKDMLKYKDSGIWEGDLTEMRTLE